MADTLYAVEAAWGSHPVLVIMPVTSCVESPVQDPELLLVAGIEVVRLNVGARVAQVIMGGSVIDKPPLVRACIRDCHNI